MSDAEAASIPDECLPVPFDESKNHLRIAAIFIILVTSAAGTLFPIIARRIPGLRVPRAVFDFAKFAGSGVIITTSLIHLLAPAIESLTSPCIDEAWTEYPYACAIAMLSIFMLFFVEFFSYRWGTRKLEKAGFGAYDPHGHDLSENSMMHASHGPEPPRRTSMAVNEDVISPAANIAEKQVSHNSSGDLGLKNIESIDSHDHQSGNAISQIIGVAVLEFGVVFHSIFIGLTLSTDEAFTILFIVIVFHQSFEGLGLGSRLAFLPLPKSLNWVPYAAGIGYACVTPIGMAIGLGVRHTYQANSTKALVTSGILDSISAGILLYTGLVELLAHEFLFNPEMQKTSDLKVLYYMGCMAVGAGVMALLGKWA